MATKSQKPAKTAKAALELKTISEDGKTVNQTNQATGTNVVTINFRSRVGQKFTLASGRVITLVGSGIHLRDTKGGILPPATYTVNVLDAKDWAEIKKTYGAGLIDGWMREGVIVEEASKREGVRDAFETELEDGAADPIVLPEE